MSDFEDDSQIYEIDSEKDDDFQDDDDVFELDDDSGDEYETPAAKVTWLKSVLIPVLTVSCRNERQ